MPASQHSPAAGSYLFLLSIFPHLPFFISLFSPTLHSWTQVSENLMSLYLDEYKEVPWDALKYLIAGVNYGGHVTDDWDRRLLTTYINDYFCEGVVNTPFFKWVLRTHTHSHVDARTHANQKH